MELFYAMADVLITVLVLLGALVGFPVLCGIVLDRIACHWEEKDHAEH